MKNAKLQKIISTYLKELHEIYSGGSFREESFYPALKALFEESSHVLSVDENAKALVLPKRTEVGIPDFLIRKDGEIVGHIEAKKPDSSLHAVEVSEQLKRYRDALPNLILTNFLEFWLYRDGKLVYKAEISSLSALQDVKPPAPENLDSFFELLSEFYSFSTPELKSASELAVVLAKKTRFAKTILEEVLAEEKDPDYPYPLIKGFYDIFKDTLIEELTEEGFVDLYAQTITYGLFAAKMMAKDTEINKDNAWGFIPRGVPLLAKIFYSFSGPNTPESLSWVIDDLVRVLNKTHISAIYEESFRQKRDPVIHFYETFLATYNPKQREQLGVYYTPLPVVSYIVRSIHGLLKSRFGKDKGFAEDDVMLLDPAAGTLTFVLRAIREALSELDTRGLRGLVPSYIERHILQQFFAFELLIVPYIIGHLRVSMALEREWGYEFKEHERLQFYLTNTLEMREPKQETIFPELTKEGQEAKRVKENVPILVVLGNPPYSGISENKGKWITGLIEDYKYVDDKPLGEKNPKWLQDDYVKFIRFGQWKIDRTGEGILGFITNHSYLDNPTFRGMRQSLMQSFDEIYLLNLHGNSLKKEKCPDGSKDDNVFDIRQGVTIGLFIKNLSLKKKALPKKKEQNEKGVANVYYAEKWGLREAKYKWLLRNDIETTEWEELKPNSPFYFFVQREETYQEEYEKYWKVTDIFPVNSVGIVTSRDKFVIDSDRDALKRRIERFRDLSISNETVRQNFNLKDTKGWKLKKSRAILNNDEDWENKFISYYYRPFDVRWLYYHDAMIERSRKEVMRHMISDNLGLLVPRQIIRNFQHAFCTNHAINFNALDTAGRFGSGYLFPLYLYPDESKGMLLVEKTSKPDRTANFTAEFLQAIKEALGTEPTPEKILYYIYAVLYSPTYRKRYEEFLKIDFPRIPLPANIEKFSNLSELGKELVELHLLKHPSLSETKIGFPVSGSNTVERVKYDEETSRVYFNKEQYFEGVSKAVWEYQIGGYQVMAKYLKDRKKRALSLEEIEHYRRVAKAIERTIEVQEKVEKVYGLVAMC